MIRSTLFFFFFFSFLFSVGQPKKIQVAADGSGDYKTVQESFNAIPSSNNKPITIFVKN